jgi:hypothetical protein
VLFLGVLAFALAILRRLGRAHRWLGAVAAVTAFACLGRLALEAAGRSRGALESIAPLSFLLLVACLAVLSFRSAERR